MGGGWYNPFDWLQRDLICATKFEQSLTSKTAMLSACNYSYGYFVGTNPSCYQAYAKTISETTASRHLIRWKIIARDSQKGVRDTMHRPVHLFFVIWSLLLASSSRFDLIQVDFFGSATFKLVLCIFKLIFEVFMCALLTCWG